ncbi:hypothetical protein E4U53_000657 [Claviceps sorghi]|nr:hypothetical protein E4U53_000657 [Claviceps sorghi]
MVQYMYESDFDIPDDIVPTGKYLPFLESVFAIGSKYKIRGLEACSRTRYASELEYLGAKNEMLSSLTRIYTADDKESIYGILDDAVWLRIRAMIGMSTSNDLDFLLQWPDFTRDFVKSLFRMGPLVGECKCSMDLISLSVTEVYKIEGFPFIVVEAMVQFLYEGSYEVPKTYSHPLLRYHEDMFAIGKKYGIDGLETRARWGYIACCQHRSSTVDILSSLERIYLADKKTKSRLCGIADEFTWLWIKSRLKHTSPKLLELMHKCPELAEKFCGPRKVPLKYQTEMSPELSTLLKTLQKQCNAENGRKALAIANALAKATAANRGQGPEREVKRWKPRHDKEATCESLEEKGPAKVSLSTIFDKVQDFARKHPEAAAVIQKHALELGKMALKR